MNLIEAGRSLRKLGLSGMAEHLELRILEAQTSRLAPLDFLSLVLADEMQRRADRLIARRIKQARFRDADKSLDNFDYVKGLVMWRTVGIRWYVVPLRTWCFT